MGIGPGRRWWPGSRASGRTTASPRSAAAAPTPPRWRWPRRCKADRCDIYTDVDGVYTTDPRIVPKARKLGKIAYEEMLELASVGAKVLQTRSVELAMKERVRVQVLSSFEGGNRLGSDLPGTLVVDEDEIVEKEIVAGIAYSRDEAKITVRRVPDRPGIAAAIFGPLAGGRRERRHDRAERVRRRHHRHDLHGRPDRPAARTEDAGRKHRSDRLSPRSSTDSNVAKISVVGVGMRSHAGVANTMFRTLAAKGINIQVISTSEIKVSVLIGADYTELAVRALHTAYGLDAA